MILYVYDHCPYCVKARMIFGLKGVSFKLVTWLNDDVDSPVGMVGVKQAPVLEFDKGQYMPESLDIVRYVDQKHAPEIMNWQEDQGLSDWLQSVGSLGYHLAMPRWVQAPLEEFKTQSARAFFQNRLEKKIGLFSQALEQSSAFKQEMEQYLVQLEGLVKGDEDASFFKSSQPSVNDLNLFALLRSLTIVKDLKFPKKVNQYMQNLASKSKIPLHTDIAL